MSDRPIRVAKLVREELSGLLHSRWRSESAAITLTDVTMPPDLQKANVYYSVIGDRLQEAKAAKFLAKTRNELRYMIGRRLKLKFTPELYFIADRSAERTMRVLNAIDEIEREEAEREEAENAESQIHDCDGSHHAAEDE